MIIPSTATGNSDGLGSSNCLSYYAPIAPHLAPTYGKLAEALAAAQGELKPAAKDSANPFFKSKYADLSSVWEAIRAALAKNGLAVVQKLDVQGDKLQTVLVTMLLHKSGEFIASTYPVKPIKDDPQGLGSAITYARRYALSAMVGVVADEDDDGEAATRTQKVASVTGEVEKKRPKWPPEQTTEYGAIRAAILELGGDAGERDVAQLQSRMKYDAPTDVIDAMAKLQRTYEEMADRAKGAK